MGQKRIAPSPLTPQVLPLGLGVVEGAVGGLEEFLAISCELGG